MRIVAATHRALERNLDGAAFRADLFYRLNAVRLRLPPLQRARAATWSCSPGTSSSARRAPSAREPLELFRASSQRLLRYHWPGNVRELANGCALRRARGRRARHGGPEHWPDGPSPSSQLGARGLHAETRALEERRLREALMRTRWNKSRAARSLGLSRQGLLKKLRRYGLAAEAMRPTPMAPSMKLRGVR